MSDKIKLADSTATNAWQSAGLGAFGADSDLAEEIDANHDGEITADEIQEYEKAHSTTTTTTTTTTNSTEYTVVNYDGSSQNLDYLKEEMNDCITSLEDMDKYIESLTQDIQSTSDSAKNLKSDTNTIANSTNDGTGSGKSSAYSLTMAGEDATTTEDSAVDSTNSTDNTDKTSAEDTNKQKEINDKTNKLTNLNDSTTSSSSKLSKVAKDIETTGDSVDKILNKVGKGSTSSDDTGSKAVEFTGIGIETAGILTGGIGIVAVGLVTTIFGAIFGMSAADKKKAEIRKLGQTAQQDEEKAKNAVSDKLAKIGDTSDTNQDSSNNISNAQKNLDDEKDGNTNQTTSQNKTTDNAASQTTDEKKNKKTT